jgi:hypothetical protein
MSHLGSGWTFHLADRTDTALGELSSARNKQLSLGLNIPGRCSFTIPMEDTLAQDIAVLSTQIMAYRDGELKWSGPVWSITEELPASRMSVTAVGWYEILNRRFLSADLSYASTDAGAIATALLANANATSATGITIGSVESTQLRTRTYKRYQNVGQEIRALAEIEAGYDLYVDPSTRQLNIYAARKTIQTNTVFQYGASVQSVSRQIMGETVANKIFAMGTSTVGSATDSASVTQYGLLEAQESLTEVNSTTIVAAFANAEVAIRSQPRQIINLTPFPWTTTNNVPRLFEDYDVGDVVYLDVEYGTMSLQRQAIRVFGVEISINENGNELITSIETSPSS